MFCKQRFMKNVFDIQGYKSRADGGYIPPIFDLHPPNNFGQHPLNIFPPSPNNVMS